MTRIAAQVVLSVDENGKFRAEMARPGSPLRQPIELRNGMWEPVLRAEMLTLSELNRANHAECDRIAAENKRKSLAERTNRIARDVFEMTAKRHSKKLANRCVPGMKAKIKHVAEGGFVIEVGNTRMSTPKVNDKDRFASAKAAAKAATEMGLKVSRGRGTRDTRPNVAIQLPESVF